MLAALGQLEEELLDGLKDEELEDNELEETLEDELLEDEVVPLPPSSSVGTIIVSVKPALGLAPK